MANTLRIILCGGAGISIGDKVVNKLEDLGSGFSNIEKYYVDSTKNNINKVEHDSSRFFQIKNTTSSGVEIDGSGGERSTNFEAASINVKEFVDKHKLNKKVTGEYHVVVFSFSGGTGSAFAPFYIRECLANNIPVIAVGIGDNISLQFAKNTNNTLATLNNFSKAYKKCLSMVYVNNASFKDKLYENEKKANKYIFNLLSALSLFLSGENESLDSKDMENFVTLSNNTDVDERHHGLYNLILFSGSEINLPEDAIPLAVRSLTADNLSPDLEMSMLLSRKHGYITDANAYDIYKGSLPMHLVSVTNFLENEKAELLKTSENFYNAKDAVKTNGFDGTSRSVQTDDGFVM